MLFCFHSTFTRRKILDDKRRRDHESSFVGEKNGRKGAATATVGEEEAKDTGREGEEAEEVAVAPPPPLPRGSYRRKGVARERGFLMELSDFP